MKLSIYQDYTLLHRAIRYHQRTRGNYGVIYEKYYVTGYATMVLALIGYIRVEAISITSVYMAKVMSHVKHVVLQFFAPPYPKEALTFAQNASLFHKNTKQ